MQEVPTPAITASGIQRLLDDAIASKSMLNVEYWLTEAYNLQAKLTFLNIVDSELNHSMNAAERLIAGVKK